MSNKIKDKDTLEETSKKEKIKIEMTSKNDNKKSFINKKNEKIKDEEEKKEKLNKSIRRFGNFLLTVIVTLIVGTGALVYYLSYTNNENISASDLFQNNINENTAEGNENSVDDSVALGNIIDSAVSSVTNGTNTTTTNTIDTVDASSRKVLNENMIILYNGLLLDTSKMDKVELKYIDNSSTDKEKYEITYYSYEKFKLVDSGLGTLSSQIYDGLIKIENVGKVAISEDYDAVPRAVKVVNSIPTIVSDNNPKLSNYDLKKAIIVDLDGNGTDEYILILANTTTGYSKITLVDSKGAKVDDLAYIEKSKWESVLAEEYHLSISNVEVLDIDNDGIMEILIEIPKYEGEPSISLLKYKNGELTGTTNIECSLLP
jgi:hypothetical protein